MDQAHLINLVSQFLAWAVRNGNEDLRLVMEYAGRSLIKEVMQNTGLETRPDSNDQPREEVMPAEATLPESPPGSLTEGTLHQEVIADLRDKLTAAHVRLQEMAAETARKKEVNYAAQKRWREERKAKKQKKAKAKNGSKRKSGELTQ